MPKALVLLRYRERFHLSWGDVATMPYAKLMEDLAILGLEAEVKNKVIQSNQYNQLSVHGTTRQQS